MKEKKINNGKINLLYQSSNVHDVKSSNIFQSNEMTYLNQSEDHFLHCTYSKITRIFTGNSSAHKYSLKYTLKYNDIIEIIQCNYSEGQYLKQN